MSQSAPKNLRGLSLERHVRSTLDDRIVAHVRFVHQQRTPGPYISYSSAALMCPKSSGNGLVLLSQKVAFWELGIFDNFGRFVFRHEELRWITQ
jgi:hypothetical protein